MSVDESLDTFRDVVKEARAEGMWVRGYVSTAFGCPYEGSIAVDAVVRVAEALAEMGVDEISIGDTIGVATPNQVVDVAERYRSACPSSVSRCTFTIRAARRSRTSWPHCR